MNGIESWLFVISISLMTGTLLWLVHRDGYRVGFEHGYTEGEFRHRCVHEFYDHDDEHVHA